MIKAHALGPLYVSRRLSWLDVNQENYPLNLRPLTAWSQSDFTEQLKSSIAASAPVDRDRYNASSISLCTTLLTSNATSPGKYEIGGVKFSGAVSRACGNLRVRYRVGQKLSVRVPADNSMHRPGDTFTSFRLSRVKVSYALSSPIRRLRILCHSRLLHIGVGCGFSISDPSKLRPRTRHFLPTCFDTMFDPSTYRQSGR